MINQIRIQNFKCLLDVTLDLAPLTMLIGPNDSGKTSVLEALRLLSETAHTDKELFDFRNELKPTIFSGINDLYFRIWNQDTSRTIELEVIGSMGLLPIEYSLQLFNPQSTSTTGQTVVGSDHAILDKTTVLNDQFGFSRTNLNNAYRLACNRGVASWDVKAFVQALQTSSVYKFNPELLREASKPSPDPLEHRGKNLAAVLDTMMTGADREGFTALEATLKRECPMLKGITLRTGQRKSVIKSIEYLLAGPGKVAVPAAQVSDGVMLLTSYLALAYSDTAEIILLEEPENGLHPTRLKMIIDLLRKMTTGEIGNRKRQIILTTHSPLLLNYCQKEEVRIVRRNAEGATTITPMAQAPGIDKLLSEFALGELWYLLGEEGLLKGQRS